MARGLNPQSRFQNLGLGVMTVPYGGKTRMEEHHRGVDFANDKGTPIPSFTDGVVSKVDGGHTQGENNFGDTVEVKTADGDTVQYHHLQNINAKLGQQVRKGQQIAQMSNTGATYSQSGAGDGTHLDVRIVDAYGRYKNPMPYVNGF